MGRIISSLGLLPTNPMNLVCPLCKAKPGRPCETTFARELDLVHVGRIKAAAARDTALKKAHKKDAIPL